MERDHEAVLADEESVREVARLLGLEPRGMLSFLLQEVERGETGFDGWLSQMEKLVEEGFYLHESVYLEAVREAWKLARG